MRLDAHRGVHVEPVDLRHERAPAPGLEARVAFVTALGATVAPEPLESAAAERDVGAAIERGAPG
jgi:hypothetical protein